MYRMCKRCGKMAAAGGSCPHCRRPARTTRPATRYYATKGWSNLRRRQLALEPQCAWEQDGVRCQAKATDADHIVPRTEGGADSLENLQSLCHSHHARKTSEQNPHTRRRKPTSRVGQLRRATGST